MRLLVLLCAFLSPTLASAEALSSYSLPSPNPATLELVSKLFEITGRQGDRYEVLVPASQASLLQLIAPLAELKEADTAAAVRAQVAASSLLAAENRYRGLEEVRAWMEKKEKDFPGRAQVLRYGTSAEGRPLMALRISRDTTLGEETPALLVTAATHGDERITTEVLLRLVDQLLESQEPRLQRILREGPDLYFIPVVNVDGFSRSDRYEQGRDPNRSYPYPENPQAQPTGSIRGLIDFFKTHQIIGSLDFHAYGEMVMYPWAYTYALIDRPDHDRFHQITGHMAQQNGYRFGPIAEVIYVAKGSSADYYYWQRKTAAFAVEMGSSKAPPPREFAQYVNDQAESTWRFLESFKP